MAAKCGQDVDDAIIYRTAKLFQRHQELVDRLARQQRENWAKEVSERFPDLEDILAGIKEKYGYEDG